MKRIAFIVFALSVTLMVSSCGKDYLELEPQQSVSVGAMMDSPELVEGVLEGLNSAMYNYEFSQYFGYGAQSLNTMVDFMADDNVSTRPLGSSYWLGTYQWRSARDEKGVLTRRAWFFYYNIIHEANVIIEAANAGLEKSASLEGKYRVLLGNAQVFRAYCFFNLTQLYGKRFDPEGDNSSLGVVLRLAPTVDPMPRSTVAECYTQIDEDISNGLDNILKGRELLQEQKDEEALDLFFTRKNWMSIPAAYGVAARIAMVEQKWGDAIDHCDKSLEAAAKMGMRLQSQNELLDGFNSYEAKEWIWGYHQAQDQNLKYAGWGAHYTANTMSNLKGKRFRMAVNRSLFDKMGEKDVRRKWWVCKDLGGKKPKGANKNLFRGDWETTGTCVKYWSVGPKTSVMDNVFMRLSEMYYMKAEALARLGKDTEAQTVFNKLMVTRDADYATTLTGEELVEEIIRNKRIEFYWEGLAFYEMKRLKRIPDRVNVANVPLLLSAANKNTFRTQNTGDATFYMPKDVDGKEWQFQIPYKEKIGNPLCEQNPF